jgi:secreted PhoX family phosphatase
MGRFNHEAVAVDPRTGIVYLTEDRGDSLIYRFIPNTPGKLLNGGKLQALAIADKKSFDTRNWKDLTTPKFPLRESMEVEWIDIENVESPEDDLRYQGFNKGAAVFARGEGMWYGNNEIYFACTNGGHISNGQVFRYIFRVLLKARQMKQSRAAGLSFLLNRKTKRSSRIAIT